MNNRSFLFNFVFTIFVLIFLFTLVAVIYFYCENQVFEFCDSIENGMNQEAVLTLADDVNTAERNKFSVGSATEQLSSPWWVGASCMMEFENGLLLKKWKNLD